MAAAREVWKCSAEEWEFARYHSELHRPDRGSKGIRRANIGCFLGVPITLLIYYALTSLAIVVAGGEVEQWLRGFRHSFSPVVLLGSALFFIIPYFTRERRELRKPRPREEIPYLITDDQGLLVNLRNHLAESAILYVNWHSIKRLQIDFTHDLTSFPGGHIYYEPNKVKAFEKIRQELPDFREPARQVYMDRFTLCIASDAKLAGMYGFIQIPLRWLYDGQFERLLRTIEARTGLSVQPYREGVMPAFLGWRTKGHF
ncbi:hypothetical protein [Paenibacillus koleovorans]|uniref:hypothetical protein n=1 Tax=Paenibacillus koleovorans TaxID=121608 RepID=UPI000FDB4171|nr:hypothetical protein [Paenibacillus koleovorans]